MGLAEFGFAGTEGHDGSGDGGDQSGVGWSTRGQDGERVETVAEQTRGQGVHDREAAAGRGAEGGNRLPGKGVARMLNPGADQLVAAGGVEMIAEPRQSSQAWEPRHTGQAAIGIDVRSV